MNFKSYCLHLLGETIPILCSARDLTQGFKCAKMHTQQTEVHPQLLSYPLKVWKYFHPDET